MSHAAGTQSPKDGLDPRRRRAHFRAWHRGTREADLLLGPFADAHIGNLGDADLDDFEALMEAPDNDVVAWVTGREAPAGAHDTELLAAIVRFHGDRHGTS
jgi:antitoxin CptB